MSRWCFLASALLAACGGESTTSERRVPPKDADPYVPTNPNVPPEGDGVLPGGSFEGRLGDGWDICNTTRPGLVLSAEPGSPSHGERLLHFDSAEPCPRCAEASGEYHVVLSVEPPIPIGQAASLYFDVINLAETPPTGVLVFGTLRLTATNLCGLLDVLATAPLAELDSTAAWQTRCVGFTPPEELDLIGFYVGDGAFNVGLDALRFGPPCKE